MLGTTGGRFQGPSGPQPNRNLWPTSTNIGRSVEFQTNGELTTESLFTATTGGFNSTPAPAGSPFLSVSPLELVAKNFQSGTVSFSQANSIFVQSEYLDGTSVATKKTCYGHWEHGLEPLQIQIKREPCQVSEITTSNTTTAGHSALTAVVKIEQPSPKQRTMDNISNQVQSNGVIPVGIAVARQRLQQEHAQQQQQQQHQQQQQQTPPKELNLNRYGIQSDLGAATSAFSQNMFFTGTNSTMIPFSSEAVTMGVTNVQNAVRTPPTLWQYPTSLPMESMLPMPMPPVGIQLVRDPTTGQLMFLPTPTSMDKLYISYPEPFQQAVVWPSAYQPQAAAAAAAAAAAIQQQQQQQQQQQHHQQQQQQHHLLMPPLTQQLQQHQQQQLPPQPPTSLQPPPLQMLSSDYLGSTTLHQHTQTHSTRLVALTSSDGKRKSSTTLPMIPLPIQPTHLIKIEDCNSGGGGGSSTAATIATASLSAASTTTHHNQHHHHHHLQHNSGMTTAHHHHNHHGQIQSHHHHHQQQQQQQQQHQSTTTLFEPCKSNMQQTSATITTSVQTNELSPEITTQHQNNHHTMPPSHQQQFIYHSSDGGLIQIAAQPPSHATTLSSSSQHNNITSEIPSLHHNHHSNNNHDQQQHQQHSQHHIMSPISVQTTDHHGGGEMDLSGENNSLVAPEVQDANIQTDTPVMSEDDTDTTAAEDCPSFTTIALNRHVIDETSSLTTTTTTVAVPPLSLATPLSAIVPPLGSTFPATMSEAYADLCRHNISSITELDSSGSTSLRHKSTGSCTSSILVAGESSFDDSQNNTTFNDSTVGNSICNISSSSSSSGNSTNVSNSNCPENLPISAGTGSVILPTVAVTAISVIDYTNNNLNNDIQEQNSFPNTTTTTAIIGGSSLIPRKWEIIQPEEEEQQQQLEQAEELEDGNHQQQHQLQLEPPHHEKQDDLEQNDRQVTVVSNVDQNDINTPNIPDIETLDTALPETVPAIVSAAVTAVVVPSSGHSPDISGLELLSNSIEAFEKNIFIKQEPQDKHEHLYMSSGTSVTKATPIVPELPNPLPENIHHSPSQQQDQQQPQQQQPPQHLGGLNLLCALAEQRFQEEVEVGQRSRKRSSSSDASESKKQKKHHKDRHSNKKSNKKSKHRKDRKSSRHNVLQSDDDDLVKQDLNESFNRVKAAYSCACKKTTLGEDDCGGDTMIGSSFASTSKQSTEDGCCRERCNWPTPEEVYIAMDSDMRQRLTKMAKEVAEEKRKLNEIKQLEKNHLSAVVGSTGELTPLVNSFFGSSSTSSQFGPMGGLGTTKLIGQKSTTAAPIISPSSLSDKFPPISDSESFRFDDLDTNSSSSSSKRKTNISHDGPSTSSSSSSSAQITSMTATTSANNLLHDPSDPFSLKRSKSLVGHIFASKKRLNDFKNEINSITSGTTDEASIQSGSLPPFTIKQELIDAAEDVSEHSSLFGEQSSSSKFVHKSMLKSATASAGTLVNTSSLLSTKHHKKSSKNKERRHHRRSSSTKERKRRIDQRCTLTSEYLDNLSTKIKPRVLTAMGGLFYAGCLSAIQPPDIYAVTLDGERGNRPHIMSREEILRDAIVEVAPEQGEDVLPGTRLCAYWSQQYRCLYPGTAAPSSLLDLEPDPKFVVVEFDDGDSGRIAIDDIRLLLSDYPIVEYDPNPLLSLGKRKQRISTTEVVSNLDVPPLVDVTPFSGAVSGTFSMQNHKSHSDIKESNKERRRLKKIRKDKLKLQLTAASGDGDDVGNIVNDGNASLATLGSGNIITSNNKNGFDINNDKKHKHKHKCGDEFCKHRKHKKRRKHKKHHHRDGSGSGGNDGGDGIGTISDEINSGGSNGIKEEEEDDDDDEEEENIVDIGNGGNSEEEIEETPVEMINSHNMTLSSLKTSVKKMNKNQRAKLSASEAAIITSSATTTTTTNTTPATIAATSSITPVVSTNVVEDDGDDDVFNPDVKEETMTDDLSNTESSGSNYEPGKPLKDRKSSTTTDNYSKIAAFLPARQLWNWFGKGIKRAGAKGRGKKQFFRTIQRGKESITVGDSAVFLSTGRPDRPYIGRIEQMWETSTNNRVVRVKWYYHPEETTGCPTLTFPGGLFQSPHADENDVQTISHKCKVLPFDLYVQKHGRDPKEYGSVYDNNNKFYLAGHYDPTSLVLKLETHIPTDKNSNNNKLLLDTKTTATTKARSTSESLTAAAASSSSLSSSPLSLSQSPSSESSSPIESAVLNNGNSCTSTTSSASSSESGGV